MVLSPSRPLLHAGLLINILSRTFGQAHAPSESPTSVGTTSDAKRREGIEYLSCRGGECPSEQGKSVVAEETETSFTDPKTKDACGIWLAPSTIPGSGLGMFAGRDFSKDEYLQEGGDLVIPIIDLREHAQGIGKNGWKFLWDDYTWDAETLYMSNEGFSEVNAASPGFGSAANCFLDLDNVDEWFPLHDYADLHRSKDPGVGAFTPYHGRKSSARMDIKAGEELFVTYGDHWFEARTDAIGFVPLKGDLAKATKLAKKFLKLRNATTMPESVLKDLWDEFVHHSRFNKSHVLSSYSGRFHEILQLSNVTLQEIRREESSRSLEWLEENGICGDNIVPQISMLKQAGRGGFASRFLSKGSVVARIPLIHITERDLLNVYDFTVDDAGNEPRDRGKANGISSKQLLINYCFGHNESTLLLCPYGPMVNYINHNRSMTNVHIRWPDSKHGNHMPELLGQPIERLDSGEGASLAFDLIATRDIRKGEELYLDYGQEWEEAWQRHVAAWKTSEASDSYIPAWILNKDRTTRIKTQFEQLHDKTVEYPANLDQRCDMTVQRSDAWKDFTDEKALEEYLYESNGMFVTCEILRYSIINGTAFYTVVMIEPDSDDPDQVVNHLVQNIPRAAIRFFDRSYTSDIFIPNAFRHDIRIPDSIFPMEWRNLAASHNETNNLQK